MYPKRVSKLKAARILALAAVAGATACSGELGTDPGSSTELKQFFEEITLGQFEEAIASGPASVEIKLGEGLVARSVEVDGPGAEGDDEEILARVLNVDVTDALSSLTLDLNGLAIQFGAATEFRIGDDNVSFGAFVEHLNAILAEGHEPWVKAERPRPDVPQDPDDPTFFATDLRLVDGHDHQKLEVFVDGDNLLINDTPPPDAWLEVFGVKIELRISTGETELEEKRDEARKHEFEGVVHSVDPEDGQVILESGTVLIFGDGSEIVQHDQEDDDHSDDRTLGTLSAVQEALDAGETVFVFGNGIVQGEGPLTLLVIEAKFEIEPPPMAEFEGIVNEVSVDEGFVVLDDGTKIVIEGDDVIESGDDGTDHLLTLAAVQEAVAAGDTVKAEGHGVIESESPHVILARKVEFEIENDDDDGAAAVADFTGIVTSVSEGDRAFHIGEDIVILVTENTMIDGEGDITTFEGLVEAFNADVTVRAEGAGNVESDGTPTVIAATHLKLQVDGGN